jgi:hypothetical protein
MHDRFSHQRPQLGHDHMEIDGQHIHSLRTPARPRWTNRALRANQAAS